MLTRTGLAVRLRAQHPQFSRADCDLIVKTLLGGIAGHLAAGGRVEIRGFGAFTVRKRKARAARNPRTGTLITVQDRLRTHFKAGNELRDGVKNSAQGKASPLFATHGKWDGLVPGSASEAVEWTN